MTSPPFYLPLFLSQTRFSCPALRHIHIPLHPHQQQIFTSYSFSSFYNNAKRLKGKSQPSSSNSLVNSFNFFDFVFPDDDFDNPSSQVASTFSNVPGRIGGLINYNFYGNGALGGMRRKFIGERIVSRNSWQKKNLNNTFLCYYYSSPILENDYGIKGDKESDERYYSKIDRGEGYGGDGGIWRVGDEERWFMSISQQKCQTPGSRQLRSNKSDIKQTSSWQIYLKDIYERHKLEENNMEDDTPGEDDNNNNITSDVAFDGFSGKRRRGREIDDNEENNGGSEENDS
jgi:hypothetical protein